MQYHSPVLLKQCIEGLAIHPDGVYVDVTFGGGGHSKEILKCLKSGKLVGFDQDADAHANLIDDERLILVKQNFRYLKNNLRFHDAYPIDGLLADLGVSSHQFDTPERGFSTRFEGELDMRMDTSSPLTAKVVVNEYEEDKLISVFKYYGELYNASRLAGAIIKARENGEIRTTMQLKEIVKYLMPRNKEAQMMAQLFQALRIEVNQELEVLKEMLEQALDSLKPGGRLVVISYHSLEDRLVKNFMKAGNFEGELVKDFYGHTSSPFKLITKKPIVPDEEEIKINSRARSAKLRIAEKI